MNPFSLYVLFTISEILEDEKESLHGENLKIQKALREVEAELVLANEDNDRLNDELQEYYKKSSELQVSYKICDQERMDNHQQILMLNKKVERLEADLAEALKEKKWLKAELENYTGNNRQNIEALDGIAKTQLAEVQSIMDDHRYTDVKEPIKNLPLSNCASKSSS
ncbi:hypothetical protein AWC38_SpisGene1467 [Stylophora pistillata]|uniref:Uncharacterized protein n=1 Tax=Stylophora pistillata TaxID=50429 RepID=A0A2B4SW86_STYPI|nr:hypothetical protein AWC38_SpisGene1467 [Stylophora pistillata]